MAVLRGCVCELLPGVNGEVVGVQGDQSAQRQTSNMDVQFICHLNKRLMCGIFSTQALSPSCR